MPAYWTLSAEPQGIVITVEAALEGTNDSGWHGRVTTAPFGSLAAEGRSHNAAREWLAIAVLAEINAGAIPLPRGTVSAVRVMSTSAAGYRRGGDHSGPVISIPAVADRDHATWCAATTAAAGPLAGHGAIGDTLGAARSALAEMLMVALDVGIDGLPPGWSGIRLLTVTRKTYPVEALPAA